MGAVHDGSGGDGGLVVAGTALANASAANGVKFFASVFWAHKALGKLLAKQFFPASLFCVIPAAKFFEADCRRLCHDDIFRPLFKDIIAQLLSIWNS